MVGGAADLNGDHFVLSSDASDVCPDAFLNIRRDPIDPSLRAENDVEEYVGICVRHRFNRRYATRLLQHDIRGLKPTAKFIGRYAAEIDSRLFGLRIVNFRNNMGLFGLRVKLFRL